MKETWPVIGYADVRPHDNLVKARVRLDMRTWAQDAVPYPCRNLRYTRSTRCTKRRYFTVPFRSQFRLTLCLPSRTSATGKRRVAVSVRCIHWCITVLQQWLKQNTDKMPQFYSTGHGNRPNKDPGLPLAPYPRSCRSSQYTDNIEKNSVSVSGLSNQTNLSHISELVTGEQSGTCIFNDIVSYYVRAYRSR